MMHGSTNFKFRNTSVRTSTNVNSTHPKRINYNTRTNCVTVINTIVLNYYLQLPFFLQSSNRLREQVFKYAEQVTVSLISSIVVF